MRPPFKPISHNGPTEEQALAIIGAIQSIERKLDKLRKAILDVPQYVLIHEIYHPLDDAATKIAHVRRHITWMGWHK